jgi:glucan phosphoethanolaminetransferase (alkaline phosphatase superfamily)
MLTAEEQKFMQYWEQNREAHSSFISKLLRGLPMACVFGLPILLLIVSVYFFMPDWYTKISNTSPQTFFVVVIAVIIAILFYAVARMHFKWEMNDQLYQELKQAKNKLEAAKNL